MSFSKSDPPNSQRPSPSSSSPSPQKPYRDTSNSSTPHTPLVRSRLWQSHQPGTSPEEVEHLKLRTGGNERTKSVSSEETDPIPSSPPRYLIDIDGEGAHPTNPTITRQDFGEDIQGDIEEPRQTVRPDEEEPNAHTSLLDSYNHASPSCGARNCDHGTFSPRPASPEALAAGSGGLWNGRDEGSSGSGANNYKNDGGGLIERWLTKGLAGGSGGGGGPPGHGRQLSTTQMLARRHGLKNRRGMYLAYYFPFFNWASQYKLSYLKGDTIAALTMASFYIPMSLSYASNLGHIPPINGLYAFVFNPLIYAFLGTSLQMVVGPEAAGSLLVGSVVRSSVELGHSGDEDEETNARIAGVVTGMAGAAIFVAGLTRLGFLDNVLSRPFLRGFISAIGFVILVNELIPEMGLTQLSKDAGVSHGTSFDKLIFIFKQMGNAHGLTCAVAFGSFAIIMVCRTVKKRLQPRVPSMAYVPDRFLVVALSAVCAWGFSWDKKGLSILGDVQSSTGSPFPFRLPFIPSHMNHIREAMGTSFLIALLGFFESSVAAKALGDPKVGESIQGMSLSANRELVALGLSNIVGGCFMALPAFGGYGRSKVNASTGGRTPMSSIILSLITVICILFLLPYFYYIPKAVLSAMISVVAYSLIEECPEDIKFFIQIRGWSELTLMFLIFAATILYSLPLGVSLGMGLSILSVIKHATKPRIQILGKVPGTTDQFENAEDNPQGLEFIEGALIVKIPEPLTFANTGDLKNRLRRLEAYGITDVHPALPRVRPPEHNQNIIFDIHGVTGIDGSGTQVLKEIVDGYVDRGVRVYFCRVPNPRTSTYKMLEKSGIVVKCGGPTHFLRSVEEALKMADLEDAQEWARNC